MSWRALGATVRGAAHQREGLPNQDGVALFAAPGAPAHAIAAVADGHGGARHFRSALGAAFAVETAIEVLRDLAAPLAGRDDEASSALIAEVLPERIAAGWRDRAQAHLALHAIAADELARVARREGEAAAESVRGEPLLAYGATLLAGIATDGLIALAQLGDGDILAVGRDGATTRPIAHDARLIGNRTTSLCGARAARDFRTAVLRRDAGWPALVLLATDGYANSFRSDADFMLVGRDYAAMIAARGGTAVAGELEEILRDASEQGSGDDITVALLSREEVR